VRISDPFDGKGTFELLVQRLSAAGACVRPLLPGLRCNTTFAGNLDALVDSDLIPFAFTVAESDRVWIAVSTGDWTLYDGAGRAVCNGSAIARFEFLPECAPLKAAGNPYSVEVRPVLEIEPYRIEVQLLNASAACESAGDCRLDSDVDTELYGLTVSTPGVVSIDVAAAPRFVGIGPNWRLLDASGRPVPGCERVSGQRQCGPLDPAANPYRVQVSAGAPTAVAGAPVPYTVAVQGATACPCGQPCLPVPPSNCGNGVLDTGEECDEGPSNGQISSCCTSACRLRAAGAPCRPAIDLCDVAERCSGTDGGCPPDRLATDGTPCAFPNLCTQNDRCRGGICEAGDVICDFAVGAPRLGARNVPRRIPVSCLAERGSGVRFCAAQGFVTTVATPTAVPGGQGRETVVGCAATQPQVAVTGLRRQRFKRNRARFGLPLNSFGRSVFRSIAPQAQPAISVCGTLGRRDHRDIKESATVQPTQ